MKLFYFVVILAFLVSACNQATTTPTAELPTIPPTLTQIPPTITPTLSPTPEPAGGGGTIFVGVNKLLYPKEFTLDKPFGWFSATSNGSNLKSLDYEEIYRVSSDGKRMLVKQNGSLVLVNPDGANSKTLDTGTDVYIPYSSRGVLWLTNEKIVFLAAPKQSGEKSSMYVVNADGSGLTKLEKPMQDMGDVAVPLFGSNDAKSIYWVTGTDCHDRGICNEKYFVTKVDDTDQNQIWQNIQAASDRVYVSPSGKFILYYSYFGWSLKNGCILATVEGQTLSAVNNCYAGVWSPVEDKLLEISWTQKNKAWLASYVIWTEPGNQVTKLPAIDAAYCSANWTPDGEKIFLSRCVDNEVWGRKTNYLGSRLINISDGTITEYPDSNMCVTAISPDSKWVISYNCYTSDSKPASSQLINLETKEAQPVLEGFVSTDPKALQMGMSFYWVPPTNFVSSAVPLAKTSVTGRISPKDEMVSVFVPQGEFTMGNDKSQDQQNVKPAHSVNLDAYWIDQIEITNRMYVMCIQDGGCTPPKYYTGKPANQAAQGGSSPNLKMLIYENYLLPDAADLPVLNVSWDQAQGYCAWAGRQLPTEAQWEKAARGTDGRTYPWGEQSPDRTLLNNYYIGPVQIGSYPDGASPYGALDMAGNVWEYVSDWYDRGYYASSPKDNPTGPATGVGHVVRGGAWYTIQKVMTYYRAFEGSTDLSLSRIGFRCSSSQ